MEEAPDRAAGLPEDEAGFAALVREHGDAVFGLALRRVGDRGIAEDLAQETFLRAWRGRSGYRGETTVRGWLCTIAVNVVRDWARRRGRRPAESFEPDFVDVASSADDPAARAEVAEAIDRLRTALAGLPSNHREMFLLRERDGLSYAEIASVLACPIGTVMSGLARARERLLEAVSG
ncbi:MAG TPA: sigma-70 family RNA polymerase sigma factor [Actinomycetota bacterium]|nr:sigma-70 family RNA polymerase sigma factor [Actinomycetota bacterium]